MGRLLLPFLTTHQRFVVGRQPGTQWSGVSPPVDRRDEMLSHIDRWRDAPRAWRPWAAVRDSSNATLRRNGPISASAHAGCSRSRLALTRSFERATRLAGLRRTPFIDGIGQRCAQNGLENLNGLVEIQRIDSIVIHRCSSI